MTPQQRAAHCLKWAAELFWLDMLMKTSPLRSSDAVLVRFSLCFSAEAKFLDILIIVALEGIQTTIWYLNGSSFFMFYVAHRS